MPERGGELEALRHTCSSIVPRLSRDLLAGPYLHTTRRDCMQQVKRQDIATSRPARRRRWLTRDRLTALLMITPSVIAIAVFVYGFIGWTGFVSLTKWESIAPDYTFVGFKNYTDIFNSGRFQTDVRN